MMEIRKIDGKYYEIREISLDELKTQISDRKLELLNLIEELTQKEQEILNFEAQTE